MAKLKDVNTKDHEPIIWIDDPISSLDSNHVFFIYSLIKGEIVKTNKFKQLFISTLKNPKCILFAAGIFPVWTWDSIENYAIVMLVFSLCLIPSALFWMCFGRSALLGKVKGLSTDQFYKASAMLLMICMLPMLWHFF